jgi:hypothetical protein
MLRPLEKRLRPLEKRLQLLKRRLKPPMKKRKPPRRPFVFKKKQSAFPRGGCAAIARISTVTSVNS